jgi:redox-sensing transcriptional repressor
MFVENEKHITIQALHRMPYYLQKLRELKNEGVEVVSAPKIAQMLNLNEVQVRKDFAAVSDSKGKPKAGFSVLELISQMEELLGFNNTDDAVLVGVGSLGHAFLAYKGFEEYGLNIVAAFDLNPEFIGREISGKIVLSADKISEMCLRMGIHIGIITVPEEQAQKVCDQLVAGGVLAIWNFAPVHLSVPENVLVKNENLAASLAVLSKHLKEKMKNL